MATITAPPSTPNQVIVPPTAPTPPTGTWRHPRMQEIEQRQEAAIFTARKMLNTSLFGILLALTFSYPGSWFKWLLALLPLPPTFDFLIVAAYRLLLLFGIGRQLQPYWAPKDEMSDIPLTPTQRKLLGLTPASAPATPGSSYITPPRYARSTPRSGSSRQAVLGSSPLDRSGSGSPISGSPLAGRGIGNMSGFGSSPVGSPLHRRAMEGRRWSSGASGLRESIGQNDASLFNESQLGSTSPIKSPSPSGGSRGATVALNSKWLYQRGKSRLSGGVYS